jgi:transcriptional regulator
LLISVGSEGPLASALPLLLTTPDDAPQGILSGHLSRANQQWQGIDAQDVLVVFQGVEAYITPSWYPSKVEHGKVVPTWNYTMVQARGALRLIDDRAWLKNHVTMLTRQQEGARAEPWEVRDAPEDYIESQLKGIIGIEVKIRQIQGKWKVSQNRPVPDRVGVSEGLTAEGQQAMGDLVKRYGGLE